MHGAYENEFLGWQEAKRLLEELSFHNVLIEKPRIKHSKNKDLLHELPFYDELHIENITSI